MIESKTQPTDYEHLLHEIRAQLAAKHASYNDCVTSLLAVMRRLFPALTVHANPVLREVGRWTADELSLIIQEYSGFSNAAIHMFLEARIRNHWPAVTAEIVRNMDEEMGVLTRNVPHLELMRYGYRGELGIETEELSYSSITTDMIQRMTSLFCTSDNAFLAGCLLAFEGTAVDEFRIVEQMLRSHQKLSGQEITNDSLTGVYIAGHVTPGVVDPATDPEMDHYRGMMDAIGGYVDHENMPRVVRGFFAICLELNQWWEQITAHALVAKLRSELRTGTKANDIAGLFAERAGMAPPTSDLHS
jgi:hypothetical protein